MTSSFLVMWALPSLGQDSIMAECIYPSNFVSVALVVPRKLNWFRGVDKKYMQIIPRAYQKQNDISWYLYRVKRVPFSVPQVLSLFCLSTHTNDWTSGEFVLVSYLDIVLLIINVNHV